MKKNPLLSIALLSIGVAVAVVIVLKFLDQSNPVVAGGGVAGGIAGAISASLFKKEN